MAAAQLRTLIGRIRRAAGAPSAADVSDAQLLERFVHYRDQTAFELLVWRHGAMVLNVCRRVLRREHDAEDAFQAAFLTLVRKAGAIGNGASVGGWLYRVAYRIALRAGAAVRIAPLPAASLVDPSAEEPIAGLFRRELASALDEEVHRLPDKYRVAFVLCCLEGRTTEAAARSLGCPPGTVGTRLARARALLRRRLSRRGFEPSVPVVFGGLAPALPGALVDSITRAALLGTAEKAAAAGVISARAAALTKGALRTMSLTKWMLTSAAVLALGLICGGTALVACPDRRSAPPATSCAPPAPPPPADAKDDGLVLKWKFEKDKPFYQEMTTVRKQTMKVLNNDVPQTQTQTFYFSWTPTAQNGDDWTITQKIIGVKMDIDLGGSKINYDSTKTDVNPKNALSDFFTALKDATFTQTVNAPKDKPISVTKVEGRQAFLDKLTAANQPMKPLLEKILSDDALKQMATQTFAALPNKEVSKGDHWEATSTLDMGPIGTYLTTFTYTFDGPNTGGANDAEKKWQAISVTAKSTYTAPPADAEAGGLPFKVKKADLKSAKSNGVILFDGDKGRVVRMEMTLHVEGDLTIEIGGQDTNVKLDQMQTTTVRTTDANPLTATPPNDGKKEIKP